MRTPLIALLTDFGERDFFVPSLKAVIASINPEVRIVDITHDVPSFEIKAASFILYSCYAFFPEGTVFLAVVDPGVASGRQILLAETKRFLFIAPDNGLLTLPLKNEEMISLHAVCESRFWLTAETSMFEARDRMAPVAAWLTLGVPLSELGPEISTYERLKIPEPRRSRHEIIGTILYQDKFGNLMTDISATMFQSLEQSKTRPRIILYLRKAKIDRFATSYAEATDDRPFFLINSQGLVEIAVREKSAAAVLGAKPGDAVKIRLEP
ncbi:MAG: SAM-dependent chlorinase/fluorinase [Acidobacteriota bacterium]